MTLEMEKSSARLEGMVLVAIDFALTKLEKLSMMSIICRYLSMEGNDDDDSSRRKLLPLLGKQAHNAIQELFMCQKMWNTFPAPFHSPVSRPMKLGKVSVDKMKIPYKPITTKAVGGKRPTPKAETKAKLHADKDKREFLVEVVDATRQYLKEFHEIHDDNSKSVVALLRKAIKSKYKRHVRRCFKELDVKSLMSILYLVNEDQVSSNQIVSRASTHPRMSSVEGDDDVDGIPVDMYQHDESYYSFQFHLTETLLTTGEDDEDTDFEMVLHSFEKSHGTSIEVLDDEESCSSKISTLSQSSFQITNYRYNLHEPLAINFALEERTTELSASSPTNSLGEGNIINIFNKLLLMLLPQKIPLQMETEGALVGSRLLQKLVEEFRLVVMRLLRKKHSYGMGRGARLTKLISAYRLLQLEREQVKTKLGIFMRNLEGREAELDKLVKTWQGLCSDATTFAATEIRNTVRAHLKVEAEHSNHLKMEAQDLTKASDETRATLVETISFVKSSTKSLRARRHYLEASLDSLIREYDVTMLKHQAEIDQLSVEEVGNSRVIDGMQSRFKDIEEKYDEMRAMRRLKELLKNMEKADAIKQNWAARKIQVAWRKYKVAKLRKKKLKGRRKGGKKKTPPLPGPGKKGTSPMSGKETTPGGSDSRSRSKSMTP